MKTNKAFLGLGVVAALGVIALPAMSRATSVSGEVELTVEVGSAIAMDIISNGDGGTSGYTGGNVEEFGLTAVAGPSSAKAVLKPNQVNTSMNSRITVYTNASSYDLSVAPKTPSVTALISEGGASIPAIDDPAGATLVAGTAAWGYNLDGGDTFKGLANGDTTLIEDQAISGTTTTVTYGVATAGNQPQGVYKNTLVYTATAND